MTDYNWNGAEGDYLDPAQWTPNDVPLYGSDTVATVGGGTATLSDAEPNGITLALGVTGVVYQTVFDGNGPPLSLYIRAELGAEQRGARPRHGARRLLVRQTDCGRVRHELRSDQRRPV